MADIPHPSDSPYDTGDSVRIYLSEDDADAQYHGLVCEVVEDDPDGLSEVTGRDVDSHHYRVRRVDTGDELPVSFRHADLVPLSEWPES
ncbi:hypothetical protein [Halovenus sp. HT40]|uniref:hypothetical protein n=1 Tax=Halovenus sp. HT40 TaxID=3126691 RepID=UPI00300F1F83